MDHQTSRGEAAKPASERGVIMSVVQGGMAEPRPAPGPSAADTSSNRYFGAFDLLDSASKALEFLEGRRGDLETALEHVSRRAEEAVAASADRAAEWQRFAADLKARNAELERQVEVLGRRAALAETECGAERERADIAERRSGEAQKLLRGLHDKVMSAFGEGTKAYDILSVVPASQPSGKVVALPKAG